MLGYIISEHPGQADHVLGQLATDLMAAGLRLTGATQVTDRDAKDARQKMVLHVLPDGPDIPISQDLGRLADACSLDPDGLEQAAGLIATALDKAPDLVLLNKFGKQEAEGQGFRALIGTALTQGIPVLIGVGREKLPAFTAFAGDLASELPKDLTALHAWVREQVDQG